MRLSYQRDDILILSFAGTATNLPVLWMHKHSRTVACARRLTTELAMTLRMQGVLEILPEVEESAPGVSMAHHSGRFAQTESSKTPRFSFLTSLAWCRELRTSLMFRSAEVRSGGCEFRPTIIILGGCGSTTSWGLQQDPPEVF